MTDNKIIVVVCDKDAECFQEIVRRYKNKLTSYVRRFVGNSDDVDDLVQTTFVKTYHNLHRFDQKKKFSSWIYRIAHNEAINHLKKKGDKRLVGFDDISTTKDQLEASQLDDTSLDKWFQEELRDEMKKALEKLSKSYRDIICMKYFDDLSYKEISKKLKMPTSTVGTLLRRARKKLFQIVMFANESKKK